ncbi:MAG: hypothetical protein RL172_2155 [Bacteroidota bacterium]
MIFEPLNVFFDKIYVLTLQRATDRHAHIANELQGLNYSWWYGADKTSLNLPQLQQDNLFNPSLARQHHLTGKDMRPGEMGCAISHRMMYEDVVKNGYQKVLILEDDVVIDKTALASFSKAVAELPANWQLWYLGFDKNDQPPGNAFFKKMLYHFLYAIGLKKTYNHTQINHLYASPYSAHLATAGFHFCTHAYAITNQAADILLHMQTPVSYVADHLLGYATSGKKINGFINKPPMINQQYQVSSTPIKSYLHQ